MGTRQNALAPLTRQKKRHRLPVEEKRVPSCKFREWNKKPLESQKMRILEKKKQKTTPIEVSEEPVNERGDCHPRQGAIGIRKSGGSAE